MSTMSDLINTAFASDSSLRKRIYNAIDETPQHRPLLEDIAKYQLASRQFTVTNGRHEEEGQPVKKRKLENGSASSQATPSSQTQQVILEARDISFSLPQRKKFHLSVVQHGQDFHAPTTTFTICARNPATSQVELEFPTSIFVHAVRVPVPEKATKQYNYCLMPSTLNQATDSPLAPGEGLIWTVNSGPLKSCTITSSELQQITSNAVDVLEQALDAILRRSNNKLILPTEAEFACANPEAHRKNEKAYHVKAFRGSKDGFLFFLSTGIFYAFKKPLSFFPFHEIDSVSYTAVLQRTFNLVVTIRPAGTPTNTESEPQEIEFSMIDQADFAGIDSYIKRHELQDASMAEARRAKQFKVNGKQAAESEGGPGELEKAEQELVDEEDELEEDYDPGEDGDSDGSGASDEDDEYDETDGANLVEDELGSEAEEVEADEDEENEVAPKGPDPDDDDQL